MIGIYLINILKINFDFYRFAYNAQKYTSLFHSYRMSLYNSFSPKSP